MDFFGRLKDSVVSPGSYRELSRITAGSTVIYLVLLVFLVTLPVHIYRAMQMAASTDEIIATLKEELPPFVLADGELKVDGKMPIVLDDSDLDGKSSGTAADIIFIIDTTGQMDEKDLQNHTQGIFIGKDRMVQKDGLRNQTMYFRDIKELRFTKADLLALIPYMNIFAFGYVLFGSLAVLTFKLIQALGLALLVMLLAKNARASLDFSGCFNIAVYSLTLPIILDGLMMGFWPDFSMFFLIYYTVACVYIVLGVRSCQED